MPALQPPYSTESGGVAGGGAESVANLCFSDLEHNTNWGILKDTGGKSTSESLAKLNSNRKTSPPEAEWHSKH